MNNPYTASFEDVRALSVEHYRQKTREFVAKWISRYPLQEIHDQMRNGVGEVADDMRARNRVEAQRSETVELINALQLADFYFPNAAKEVSFDMRRGVDVASIHSLEDLLAGFEDHTHIDCQIRSNGREVSFQLKRYRGRNSPEDFIDWLNRRVLQHYGRMNGTSLVVLLQIEQNGEPFPLDRVYELFQERALPNVSFDSVSIMYNDAEAAHMALHELHPQHHRTLIPIDLMLARMRADA